MRNSKFVLRRAVIASVAMAAAAALALAGCSSGSSSPSASASSSGGSAAADLAKTCLPDAASLTLPKNWSTVVADARKEGTVNLYTVQPAPVTAAMVAGFTQDCPGIHVNVLKTDAVSLDTRFNAELQAAGHPSADVYESADTYEESLSHPNAFLKPTTTLIPSLSDYPKSAIQGETWIDFAYLWGIVYNTTLLKKSDIPTTWKGIASSKFANKITGADPRAATSYQSFYLFLEKTYGDSWISSLKSLNQKYQPASTPAVQAVAAGQYSLMFPAANSFSSPLILQGAPLAISFPTPSQINPGYLGVTKGGPDPNAARVFAAFYASKTGQEIQCQSGGLSSVNPVANGACAGIKLPTGLPVATSTPDQTAVTKMAAVLGLH